MATSTNISPVIPTSLLNKIANSDNILVFGDQVANQANKQLVISNQGVTQNQDNELSNLAARRRQAGITKSNTIKKAKKDYDNKKITKEQYDQIALPPSGSAYVTYEAEIAAINTNKQQIQQSKNAELNSDDKIEGVIRIIR